MPPPSNIDPRNRFPTAEEIGKALGDVLDRQYPRNPLSDQFDPPKPKDYDPNTIGPDRDSSGIGGGAGGEAAKGFLSLAAGFKSELLPTLKQVSGGFQDLVGGLQSIASLGGSPTTAISAVGGQISKMLSALGPEGEIAGQVVQTLASIPQMLKSAADSLAQYTQAFSPATAQRYQRAWSDLSASIGEQVLLIVEGATKVVRWFGDAIATLTPVIRPIVETYMSALGGEFSALGDIFKELISQGVILAEAFAPLAPLFAEIAFGPMKDFTAGLRMIAEWMERANRNLANFLGVAKPQFDGTSFGKSAVPASTTNVNALIGRANEAAFGSGRGADKSVPGRLDSILEKMDKMPENMAKTMWDKIKEIPAIKEAVKASTEGPVGERLVGQGGARGHSESETIGERLDDSVRSVVDVVCPPIFEHHLCACVCFSIQRVNCPLNVVPSSVGACKG